MYALASMSLARRGQALPQGSNTKLSGRTATPRAVDVAALADVSTATVSRSFNEPDKVAPLVRQRVLAAAAVLGWTPSAAGRALALNRTFIAGAVIPKMELEIFGKQVGALQATLAEHGITLFIGCSDNRPDEGLRQVRAMLARGIEALAIVGEAYPPALFAEVTARHIPYVVTYGYRADSPHPCIGFDNRAAFYRIGRHLIELGHRCIGLIIQPTADNDRVQARVAGVAQALAEEGLGQRSQHVCEGPGTSAFGRASLRAILAAPGPQPTAIICGNDTIAIGALLEARTLGIDVPSALSITGFDDVALAAELDPGLTTVRIANDEIGALTGRYLLAGLRNERVPRPAPLIPLLIPRGSSGPAPGAA